MSVMNELCGGGKTGVAFSLSAFTYSMFCHPERAFCAKDLCSWAVPLTWTGRHGGAAERWHHAVEFAAGGGRGGARVAIELGSRAGRSAVGIDDAQTTHEKILATVDDHGIAISRFGPQIEALQTLGLVNAVIFLNRGTDGIRIIPSFKGLDFYMRCLGYSVYPLEAFVLTLQHWCQLRNIDPFNYQKS